MQELSFKTKRKILYLEILFFAITVFIFVRLLYLQFVKSAELYKKALANQTQIIKMQANRSIIYDRSGKVPLAYNKKSMTVYLILGHMPPKATEQEIIFSNLIKIINISYNDIQTAITQQAIDKYTPVILKYDIDSATLVKLSENSENLKGVYWENIPTRVYPMRERASHLIGYTGIISKNELKKLKSNPEYHPGSIIGKMGIEGYYDEIIRGKEGIKERIVDATGNVKEEEVKKEPVPGNSLVLSIHLYHPKLGQLLFQNLLLEKFFHW